jgi:hypothetical protein
VKDRNGYGIVVGCLVRVDANSHDQPGTPDFRGWIELIDSDSVATLTEDPSGRRRYGYVERMTVLKPTAMQKARRIGQGKTITAFSDDAKRPRRLRRRKV